MPHPRRDCGLTPASRGRFPSRRSYYPRRHVQVKAEQAKSLEEDVLRGIFILATAKLKVKRAVRGITSKIGRLRSALDEAWSSFLMRSIRLFYLTSSSPHSASVDIVPSSHLAGVENPELALAPRTLRPIDVFRCIRVGIELANVSRQCFALPDMARCIGGPGRGCWHWVLAPSIDAKGVCSKG